MLSDENPSILKSLNFAHRIQQADDAQRAEVVHRLRQSMRLSYTVRGLNQLAQEPLHRPVAERALHSMGFGFSG